MIEENLQCPFFFDEEHNKHRYTTRNLIEHLYKKHNIEQLSGLLGVMIAEKEDMIPVSKIKAKIKELEDSPAPQWVGRWEVLEAKLEELEDLLPPQAKARKEKEKPEE
jgi:hypothetical protein